MNDLLKYFANIVHKNNVITKKENLEVTMRDESTCFINELPHALIRPRDRDELIRVVKLCIEYEYPLIIRGGGTGKSGGAIASKNSIVIDISRLNKIISIDKNNLLAEVEPGVVLDDLKKKALKHDLYYPPDPASSDMCLIGGNVAENAGGPCAVKYGTTKEYVLGGQAILGTGEVIDFGKRCLKGVSGYDIASLLCGSEGTLCVFTKIILRLLPKPQSIATVFISFDNDRCALSAVNDILNKGHLPKAIEYIDSTSISALKKLGYLSQMNKKSALLIECDDHGKDGALAQIMSICDDLEQTFTIKTAVAYDEKKRKNLWQARKMLSKACAQFLGYKKSLDIAVPVGLIGEFVKKTKSLKTSYVDIAFFGHAGDGNLHVQLMYDDKRHDNRINDIVREILSLVIDFKGTLTAEHGIGLLKKSVLHLEQSNELINLQRRIKIAFDPKGLLNPSKIFDL